MKQQTTKHDEYCNCIDCEAESSKYFKQNITEEQWDDVFKDGHTIQKLKNGEIIQADKMTIGGMIEFIGEDWEWLTREESNYADNDALQPKNLCDALWEACKYKLKQL